MTEGAVAVGPSITVTRTNGDSRQSVKVEASLATAQDADIVRGFDPLNLVIEFDIGEISKTVSVAAVESSIVDGFNDMGSSRSIQPSGWEDEVSGSFSAWSYLATITFLGKTLRENELIREERDRQTVLPLYSRMKIHEQA